MSTPDDPEKAYIVTNSDSEEEEEEEEVAPTIRRSSGFRMVTQKTPGSDTQSSITQNSSSHTGNHQVKETMNSGVKTITEQHREITQGQEEHDGVRSQRVTVSSKSTTRTEGNNEDGNTQGALKNVTVSEQSTTKTTGPIGENGNQAQSVVQQTTTRAIRTEGDNIDDQDGMNGQRIIVTQKTTTRTVGAEGIDNGQFKEAAEKQFTELQHAQQKAQQEALQRMQQAQLDMQHQAQIMGNNVGLDATNNRSTVQQTTTRTVTTGENDNDETQRIVQKTTTRTMTSGGDDNDQTQRIVQKTTTRTFTTGEDNSGDQGAEGQRVVVSQQTTTRTVGPTGIEQMKGTVKEQPVDVKSTQQITKQAQRDVQHQAPTAMQKAQQEALQRVQQAQLHAQQMAEKRKAMLQPQKSDGPQQEKTESQKNNEKEAQLRAQREAQEKAKKEAQLRAQREAQEKAKKEAQLRAQREAQEKAQKEAQLRAQREAQEKAQKEAQLRAQREAQEKAQKEAQLRAQRQAQEKAQKEAQLRAQRQAQEKAQKEAQLRAQRQAQEKAQKEAQLRAQRETQLRLQKENQDKRQTAAQANNQPVPRKISGQNQQRVGQLNASAVKQAPPPPQKKPQPQVPKKPVGLISTTSDVENYENSMQQRAPNVSRMLGLSDTRDDIKILRGGEVQQNYINNLESRKEEVERVEVQPISVQNDESWLTQTRTVVSDVVLPQPSKITIPDFQETARVQPTVIVPKVAQKTHFEWKEFPDEEVKELITIPKIKAQEWKPDKQAEVVESQAVRSSYHPGRIGRVWPPPQIDENQPPQAAIKPTKTIHDDKWIHEERNEVEKGAWVKLKPNEVLREKVWPPPEPEVPQTYYIGTRMHTIQWPPPETEQHVQQDVEILQTRLPVKPHQRQWPPPPPQYRTVTDEVSSETIETSATQPFANTVIRQGPVTKPKPVVAPPAVRRTFHS